MFTVAHKRWIWADKERETLKVYLVIKMIKVSLVSLHFHYVPFSRSNIKFRDYLCGNIIHISMCFAGFRLKKQFSCNNSSSYIWSKKGNIIRQSIIFRFSVVLFDKWRFVSLFATGVTFPGEMFINQCCNISRFLLGEVWALVCR